MKEFIKIIAIAIIGGLIVVGGQNIIGNHENTNDVSITDKIEVPTPSISVSNNSIGALNSSTPELKTAAKNTVHAVVYILTEFSRKSSVYDDFFSIDDFFGRRRSPSILKASGSGVIISSDGYIVTNNHVVQQADKITITLNDKRKYNATVIGTDPSTDLALLKIDEKELDFVTYGSSDAIEVGDWVLAVGNPFNLTSTVTAGIISAKARNINILGSNSAIESFLQTDAVVNPGNSGGALVDINGKLVGINAAIASRTGSYIGYSFAIPVTIVKKVVKDLREYGQVQRAYIGITIKEVNNEIAKKYKLNEIEGVLVESISDNGAAKSAGIEKGDIILEISNTKVNTTSELLEKVGLYRPGDKISLKIIHNKKIKNYDLVLTNESGTTEINDKSKISILTRTGANFKVISEELKQKLKIKNGLQVISLENGLFRSAGIRIGFIIQNVGKQKITNQKELETALSQKSGGVLIDGIYPNGVRAYYGIGL